MLEMLHPLAPWSGARIVVLDPDPRTRDLFAVALWLDRHEVWFTSDPLEAVEHPGDWDLVVATVRERDAYWQRLRNAADRWVSTPIIAMTSVGGVAPDQLAKALHAARRCSAPIDLQELRFAAQAVLRHGAREPSDAASGRQA